MPESTYAPDEVKSYLNDYKKRNSGYRYYDDRTLYSQLKRKNAENLPSWEIFDNTPNIKAQTKRKKNLDPTFVNSLYNMMDYNINEDSWGWAKSAYNNSLTGMTEELMTGKKRYDLSDYDPNFIEDVLSTVASFAMPLDLLALSTGGFVGAGGKLLGSQTLGKAVAPTWKGLSGLAKEGMVNYGLRTVGKKGINKGISETFMTSALMGINQASTLAVYEGARGGIQAGIDGTSVIEGIAKGAGRGMLMGGLSGAIGGGMMAKHSYLSGIDDATLTAAQRTGRAVTGVVGQTTTESVAQTGVEAGMMYAERGEIDKDELLKSFALNVGTFTVLKAKHNLLQEGGKMVDEWTKDFLPDEKLNASNAKDNASETRKIFQDDIDEVNINEKKMSKIVGKPLEKFEKNLVDKYNKEHGDEFGRIKVGDLDPEMLNKKYNDFLDDITGRDATDVDMERVVNSMEQINVISAVSERLLKNYKSKQAQQYKPEIQAKIEQITKFQDKWNTLRDKLNNLDHFQRRSVSFTQSEKVSILGRMSDIFGRMKKKGKSTKEINKEKRDIEVALGDEYMFDKNNRLVDKDTGKEIEYGAMNEILSGLERRFPPEQKPKQTAKFNVKKYKQDVEETIKAEGDVNTRKQYEENYRDNLKQIEDVDTTRLKDDAADVAFQGSKDVLMQQIGRLYNWVRKTGTTLLKPGQAKARANYIMKFTKWLAEKKNKSLKDMTQDDFIDYTKTFKSKKPADKTAINAFMESLTSNKIIDWNFTSDFKKGAWGAKPKATARQGLVSSVFKLVKNTLTTQTSKTGEKISYISDKLKNFIAKQRAISEKSPHEYHDEYLFQNDDGLSIQTNHLNEIVSFISGKSLKYIARGKGGARFFRKAIGNWVRAKYGMGSDESVVVAAGILNQKSITAGIPDLIKRYQGLDKNTIKDLSKKIVEEFLSDIDSGKFTSHDNKKYTSKKKYTKASDSFDIWQIKEMMDKIDGLSQKKKIGDNVYDKDMLESLFQFMIEVAPRNNEVAPTETDLKRHVKNTKYQLDDRTSPRITVEELNAQVKHFNKKLPHISIFLEKTLGKRQGQYILGKISGHMVSIAEGKASITTLPHEISHHVVDVLRAFGDARSKSLIEDGLTIFRKKGMSKQDAMEAFVESLAEYSSKQIRNKGTMSRIGSWIKNAFTHLTHMLGLSNKNDIDAYKTDIIRMIGEKVYKGKVPIEAKEHILNLKTQYQTVKQLVKSNPKFYRTINDTIHTYENLLTKQGFTKDDLRKKAKDYIGYETWGKKGKKEGLDVDVADLQSYQEYLRKLVESNTNKKTNTTVSNEVSVADIEAEYNIGRETRDNFLKFYGANIDNASPNVLKAYKYFIRRNFNPMELKGKEHTTDLIFNSTELNNPAGSTWTRPFQGPAQFLINNGGRAGKIIGYKLLDHDMVKFNYQGKGEYSLSVIQSELKRIKNLNPDLKNADKYLHLMDKGLASKYKSYFRTLGERGKAELKRIELYSKEFKKGGRLEEVKNLWSQTTKFYWNSLKKEIMNANRNTVNGKQMVDALNEKFVNDYFSRKVTRKALQIIKKDAPYMDKLVNEHMPYAIESEAKRLKMNVPTFKADKKKMEGLRQKVSASIFNMLINGPVKTKPGFLKKRGLTLDAYIKDPETGKMIETYESTMSGTMEHYIQGMSKMLATVRYFPEFTEFAGKFSLKAESPKAIIELNKLTKDESLAWYAKDTIYKELGLESSMRDALTAKGERWIGKMTNYSAAIGLSSPTSGFKNVLIQLPRSVAVYGAMNTWNAMKYTGVGGLMGYGKAYESALYKGHLGYGTKSLDLGAEKIKIAGYEIEPIKLVFEKVNMMTQTERFNRIVTSQAGKAYFTQALQALRGDNNGFLKGMSAERAKDLMRDTWKLSDKEIDFLRTEKNLDATFKDKKNLDNNLDFIMAKVEHFSHATSAGSTSLAMLPLWMSNKHMRPLTLFQRMATSVTIDSYNNYVKPLQKYGNAMPLIKAAIGHGIGGAGLYAMYDAFFDVEPPKSEGSAFDKAIMYLWRGEFLGMFGELISPYEREIAFNPVMEPVLLRNMKEAGKQALLVLNYKKPMDRAMYDWSKKSIVAIGQVDRLITKSKNPMVPKYKRMKALEVQFRKHMNYQKSSAQISSERQNFYHDLRESVYFGGEEDIAKSYYKTFNYLVTQQEKDGVTDLRARHKYAKKTIESVLKHMKPSNLSVSGKSREMSKKEEFKKFLSKENRSLLEELDKHYHYQYRRLQKIMRNTTYRRRYSVYPNINWLGTTSFK